MDDQNGVTSSQSLKEEVSVVNNQLSIVTLTSNSSSDSLHAQLLPNIPFDLIPEILCRLPVKFLLQLRCVCKSWNSLISDPKFAKKHLSLSTTCHLHFLSYSDLSKRFYLKAYPPHSIFTNIKTNYFTQLEYPPNNYDGDHHPKDSDYIVGSCNGMLCLANYDGSFVLLWNPSIRKFKELPPFQKPQTSWYVDMTYGFGYDLVTDNYKVVVVLCYYVSDSSGDYVNKAEVKVHTLGTSFWKNIQEYPFGRLPRYKSGQFVSGAINWLTYKTLGNNSLYNIVSFDLSNESYQEILQPDYEEINACTLQLGVLRDCLCMLSVYDVWVMKEYGIKESWTKLFTISCMEDPRSSYRFTKVINIFEDGQVLLESIDEDWSWNMIVYDSRNNTFKFTDFETTPEVCIESLISPCS